ncbi:unnamed protein product [Ilex paraguariensis]|uniref:SAM domain-containing protein n=1 Tax=Ilex paraguariensis TaxID=185542 RepID=A0ABC8U7K1_9AQUA
MAELQPPEGQLNGGEPALLSTENVGAKRQRRPSVRLGDIGDQLYETQPNRRTKQWRLSTKDTSKASKTRPLMNLTSSGDYHETLDGDDQEAGNLDSDAIGSWKVRDSISKRSATKRVRSNWVSKIDDNDKFSGGGNEENEKLSGGEDVDDGYRDFEPEASESPLKEVQSPIHSLDDMNRGNFHRKVDVGVARVSMEGRDCHDGVELDGPSDTDARNWNHPERNGVRVWLNQLGLGRYAPVFEIHEVDDEVLPMLTLEDLKDMGINAVGSRRKMFSSIQKLGKGFS